MRATRGALQAVVWALLASCAAAFIVPEELVSFLSIVYSNIPPIRKGTDSRVGLGFRLGPHADAQVVLELGPQTNTRPLGAAGPSFGSPSASSSKRHAALQPLDALDDAQVADNAALATPYNAAAGNWLTAWRTSIAAKQAPRRPAAPDDDLLNQADLSAQGPNSVADPTKLSGAPLVSHLRKLYRREHTPERLPERRRPERRPEWEAKQQPQQRVAAAGLLTKPSKRGKTSTKSNTKTTTAAASRPAENLSDVTLD